MMFIIKYNQWDINNKMTTIMKIVKLWFLVMAICLASGMYAKRVSKQEALQKAQQLCKDKQFSEPELVRGQRHDTLNDAYYIFNARDGGFVVASGDDRLPEILGYSDRGNIDMNNLPCNMEWLLNCYAHTLDSLDNYGITKKWSPRRTSSFATIEPLVKTTWGQHAPYNKYCPEIGGEKCPTGCVATAMAQIINYKKWPQGQTTAVDAYTTFSGINMPGLEPTSFNWNNMSDDDIARLMLYCGQAAKMNYELSGSGSGEPSEALKNVFGYSNSTKSWLIKMFDDHLDQVVYNELADDCPVFYTGYNETDKVGHAFVVDGYKDGMFHINWGWDGDADGYFIITGLTEDVMPFPSNWDSEMIVGIVPRVQDGEQTRVYVSSLESGTKCTYRKNSSEDFLFTVNLTYNMICDDGITCDVGYGLYDGYQLVKVLSPARRTSGFYADNFIIESDVPLGKYTLSLVYRHDESEEWKKAVGSNQCSMIVYVGESTLYLKNLVDNWDGHFQDFGYHVIDGVTYGLTFEYNTNWAYVLPYELTGKYSGDIVIPFTFNYEGKEFKVRSIRGSSPFEGCENLNTLSTAIDQGLEIYNCPNLSQLQLQQGNNFIIHDCPKLEEIVFPTTTQWFDLSGCENLRTIKFTNIGTTFNVPKFVEYFYPSLTDVYFASTTPPEINGYEEDYYNPHVTIHVPKGSLPLYQDSQWKLWNIVDDNVEASLVKWGYCHHDKVSGFGMAMGSKGDDIAQELAMRVAPEDMVAYKGCKITHIEIFSSVRAQNDWGYEEYEYIFISNHETDYLLKQPIKLIRGAWNSIKLDKPFTITGEELFIGFGRKGAIGILFSDDTFVPDAVWTRFMGKDPGSPKFKTGVWDYAKECPYIEGPSALKAHPLPLRFAIEGENVPEGVVLRELEIAGTEYEEGKPMLSPQLRRADKSGITINGVIRNRSLECVTSYTIEWSIDGGEKQSKSFKTILAPNESENITLELPRITTNGVHTIATNVTMVNKNVNKLEGLNMPTIEVVVTDGIDPSVVAVTNYSRCYGDKNPMFDYTVTGGNIEGTPEITCEATTTSPVGDYPIVVKQGSVKNNNVTYVNGILSITKAPLKVSVGNYEREEGEENPIFMINYEGWKNGENENVLIAKPTALTEATKESKAGTYTIVVKGGEAQNYEFKYMNGILTVTEVSGITEQIEPDKPFDVYTMTGQKVASKITTLKHLPCGLYIIEGKKIVIK